MSVHCSVFRAAHLIHEIKFFRSLGTPVDRELAIVRLPDAIEEAPEATVSGELQFRFRERCQKIEKIDLLPMELYQSWGIEGINPAFRAGLDGCRSLLDALNLFCETIHFESSLARCRVRVARDVCELFFCPPREFGPTTRLSASDWHRVTSVLQVVRRFTGPDWLPPEIDFVSFGDPGERIRSAFGGATVFTGRPYTAIRFPASLLAEPPLLSAAVSDEEPCVGDAPPWIADDEDDRLAGQLRAVMAGYLGGPKPDVALVAEMAGMSERSLQRALGRAGTSFSRLYDDCRFEAARTMLADPTSKVIDVALSVGFDDPAHFTRAFRRRAGVSPSAFKRNALAA